MTVNMADIRAADWSAQLGAFGSVVEDLDDIEQCIRTIIGTPKGSIPLEPLFGCDAWQWLDAPLDIALPNVVREVYQAIGMWEPRAVLAGVRLAPGEHDAHWRIRVHWHPAGEAPRQTEVMYAG